MSRAAIIGGLVVVAMGPVAAKPPPLDYDETERVEPWSWVSLLSALAAFDSEAPDQTGGVFGAQLRIRHGTARARNAAHRADPLRLWSFGVGVETVRLDTFEPQLLIGRHWLPKESYWYGGPFFLDLRLDVGVGYAWSRDGTTEQPFVTIKSAVGMMMTRQTAPASDDGKLRLREQIDFVVETRIAADGEWRLGFGIELDLIRSLASLRKWKLL